MKNISTLIIGFCLLFVLGCKKDNDQIQQDCKSNNYGVLMVVYGFNTQMHSITTTTDAMSFQTKTSPLGLNVDTVHLKPGSYIVQVRSISNSNQITNEKTFTSTNITQCNETRVSVDF